MTIIDQLATSLNRRDEVPNQELARRIAADEDEIAVKELVENLQNKNPGIRSDCIKVIYEIGALKPRLIAHFTDEFLQLLDSKDNRLQWGAMIALNTITNENPQAIYSALSKVIAVANKGSVITNDHCVNILIRLCAISEYADEAFVLLNERLVNCPVNQLPMYAEHSLKIITRSNKVAFSTTLASRLGEIEKEPKKRRVENVIKKVSKY